VSPPLQATRPQLPAQLLTGPICSVKMLRDRYKKWGINNKNARPRRVAVAKSRLTTQTALLHSPRVVELNDDESHIAQEPLSTQDEHELLVLRMVHSGLLTGSPRAALSTLDSKIHEILNGLSHWTRSNNQVPASVWTRSNSEMPTFEQDLNLATTRSSGKIALGYRCYVVATGLIRSKYVWSALETILLFSEYQSRDWIDWLEGRPFDQCRILWSCCKRAAQKLGPQHPVTLICIWAARGLPFEDLKSILIGVFRMYRSLMQLFKRCSISEFELRVEGRHLRLDQILRDALFIHESRLQAVAAKSAS